ncbi:exodeoxyribonuclease VII small subunit [Amphritea sp. 1_MG-2023]|uniref:exodeoxyribonuclease VII small subunit n=1 Tax=Amphritea sp. 1_MG-2023 TaxID=3062670 RepID=UPI0026E4766F|nr:exodeoxyribonuclease VII small subunit [Amphritea sp. 1_MG-2023]MDO6563066.1 exodeoxyribonuclease VII small subunit [Amphritea sp. 1_MG-2023]
MCAKKKTPDFETSLAQLESMVNQLEQGELSLEQSLQTFEQGVRLTRDCQSILADAEQKVQILIQQNGELQATPFSLSEE